MAGKNNDAARKLILPLIGLTIAYSPYFSRPLIELMRLESVVPDGPQAILVVNWLAVAALFAFMRGVEGRHFASIGLRRPGSADITWAFGLAAVASCVTIAINAFSPPPPSTGTATLLAYPIPVLMGMIMTVAISEEILFRGYAIEAFSDLTGLRWLATTLSFVLFVAPHIMFFGPAWLLYHGLAPALFYVLYLWRRNLWACMLTHFCVNAPILIPALGLVEI